MSQDSPVRKSPDSSNDSFCILHISAMSSRQNTICETPKKRGARLISLYPLGLGQKRLDCITRRLMAPMLLLLLLPRSPLLLLLLLLGRCGWCTRACTTCRVRVPAARCGFEP